MSTAIIEKSTTAIRRIIPISGKDSAVTAIVQLAREPQYTYEFVFNDTYAELPEVGAWLAKMEAYLHAPIQRIGENLEDIIIKQGVLPGHGKIGRFCTRMAKIEPLEAHVGGSTSALVYYALRADEMERVGYKKTPQYDITPMYPLRDIGFTLPLVWHTLEQLDLLPPQFFWQEVYERVVRRLEAVGVPKFLDNLTPWQRASLFSWRTRPNCFFCYYQRNYEWVGLLCTHPDLYWRASWLEENVGKDNDKHQRVAMYTWRQGESLRELAQRKDEVIEKRVKQICKAIINKAQNGIFVDDEYADELSVTSCGLYCGK